MNRLVKAVVNGNTIRFDYDVSGRRVGKIVNGQETRFLHSGDMEIAEYAADGTLQRRYIPGGMVDNRVAMIEVDTAGNQLLSYYHADRLGNVAAMTDEAGHIKERYAYDPFGSEITGAPVSGNPFRYTGRRYDPETGLYYYRARYYDPELGRFLQTDPIGYADQMNLYAYVGNDPLNFTDPSGLQTGRACSGDGKIRQLICTYLNFGNDDDDNHNPHFDPGSFDPDHNMKVASAPLALAGIEVADAVSDLASDVACAPSEVFANALSQTGVSEGTFFANVSGSAIFGGGANGTFGVFYNAGTRQYGNIISAGVGGGLNVSIAGTAGFRAGPSTVSTDITITSSTTAGARIGPVSASVNLSGNSDGASLAGSGGRGVSLRPSGALAIPVSFTSTINATDTTVCGVVGP